MNGNYDIDELLREYLNKNEENNEGKNEDDTKDFIDLNDSSYENEEADNDTDILKTNELELSKDNNNDSTLFSKIMGGYIIFIILYQFIN